MSNPHGHVVEGSDSTPEQTTYDYARDVDGNVYINRRWPGNLRSFQLDSAHNSSTSISRSPGRPGRCTWQVSSWLATTEHGERHPAVQLPCPFLTVGRGLKGLGGRAMRVNGKPWLPCRNIAGRGRTT